MIDSFLNEDNKTKIKNIIHDVLWPIKLYALIIVFILLLNVFYVYKLYCLKVT